MEIRIARPDEWNAWEEFNARHGNVFQSTGFAKVYSQTGTTAELLLALDNGVIVGGCLYSFPLTGIKRIFSELRIVSGPIVKDEKTFELILKELTNIAIANNVTSVQIKTPFANMRDVLFAEGFSLSATGPCHSFNVKLSKNVEQLRMDLDKKTRNAISKAEKSDIVIHETSDVSLSHSLYLSRTKEKEGQIPIPFEYFKAIKDNIKSHFLIAKSSGVPIAESVFLEYGDKIYYFNNGSNPEYWKYNPNELLVWHVIAANAGSCKTLNLYGVPDGTDQAHPSYGIYKFKSGFGGMLVEEFSYATKVISPLKKKIFDYGLKYALPLYKRFLA